MFERIKKAFSRPAVPPERPDDFRASTHGPVSEWAATQGFGFTPEANQGLSLQGQVGGRAWRLQIGRSSRDYITGEEVRARADLGISPEVAVLVMSRALKDILEKRAYHIYTDSLQTTMDSSMPEEMRWLALYDEVGWDALPIEFWKRYSVLTDRRDVAQQFLDAGLARMLMEWPEPAPAPADPFLILVLNGKAYLRMAYKPAELATVRHASHIFTAACEAALRQFRA